MKGTFIIDSIIVFVWRDETSTSTDFAREWGSMIPRSGNHDTKKGKRIHWSYVIFFTHGNTDTKYYMPPTYMEHIACGVINIWVCSPLNHQSIHTHTHTWYLIPTHLHEVPCFDHFGHGLAFLAQCSSLAGEVIWARYNKEQLGYQSSFVATWSFLFENWLPCAELEVLSLPFLSFGGRFVCLSFLRWLDSMENHILLVGLAMFHRFLSVFCRRSRTRSTFRRRPTSTDFQPSSTPRTKANGQKIRWLTKN